jgi:hypothetical protein
LYWPSLPPGTWVSWVLSLGRPNSSLTTPCDRSFPGRQRAVPGTGSRPGLPGYRAGGRRCVPCGEHGPHDLSRVAWRGIAPQVAVRADYLQPAAGPRPANRGVRGTGAALPGSATAHSTQGPCCSRPSRTGRRGPVSPVPAGRAAARWSPSQTPRSRCPGCCVPCPTGARWRG